MNRIIITIFILLASIFAAHAETTGPTEEDYQNIDKLKSRLIRMKRETDSFIKELMKTYPEDISGTAEYLGSDIKVDVAEGLKDITVRADLPGMDKDKISVVLENHRILKISGERDIAKKELSPGIVRQERVQGKIERILELPAECQSEGIKANYKNGVLEIVIPKKPVTKDESVKIKIQ